MRVVFPVLAGGLLLSLLIWPQIQKKTDLISGALRQAIAPNVSKAQIDMQKVQFYSEDKKGQPFVVFSDKILEIDPNQRLVQLDAPEAEMTLNSGIKIDATSPVALFYQNTDIVFFKETVNLKTDNGYVANTSEVTVDYKNQRAYSSKYLTLRGEKADLDAEGFYMRQNGQEFDFIGPAKLVLKQEPRNQQVVITADKKFEVRQKTQTTTAFGNVLADDGINKVYCDEMTAYFKALDKNRYELKSVQAKSNVKIITLTETITGNDAFYDLSKEKAFITGNVVVERLEGRMQGDRAVIDMKTGESQLETDYTKPIKAQRVRGTIFPTKLKN